jgi:hypothetical protein
MAFVRAVLSDPFEAHGIFQHYESYDGVHKDTVAVASIHEVDDQGRPFKGAATMHISNVICYDEGDIEIWGHIQWDSDCRVRLAILWSSEDR